MNKIHEWINTIGIVAIFILVLVGGNQSGQNIGATGTRFPNGLAVGSTASVTQNKLTIGNTGTALGDAKFGTCNLTISSGWLNATNASNTIQATCAVTNVASGDQVWVQLPSQNGTVTKTAFWVVGSSATSTGIIDITLFNGSGAATTSFAQATTSVRYWILR